VSGHNISTDIFHEHNSNIFTQITTSTVRGIYK